MAGDTTAVGVAPVVAPSVCDRRPQRQPGAVSDDRVLYLARNTSRYTPQGPAVAIYRSSDGGASWVETADPGSYLLSQGWYDNAIVCHPTDPTIVYVGGPQLYSIELPFMGSSNRNTVALASYWFPHPDHHVLEIVRPEGGDWFLLGTNDGGVQRTASGVTGFSMRDQGMVTTQFYGIDKRPGASAYVGGTQDNGTVVGSIQSGHDGWRQVLGGDARLTQRAPSHLWA